MSDTGVAVETVEVVGEDKMDTQIESTEFVEVSDVTEVVEATVEKVTEPPTVEEPAYVTTLISIGEIDNYGAPSKKYTIDDQFILFSPNPEKPADKIVFGKISYGKYAILEHDRVYTNEDGSTTTLLDKVQIRTTVSVDIDMPDPTAYEEFEVNNGVLALVYNNYLLKVDNELDISRAIRESLHNREMAGTEVRCNILKNKMGLVICTTASKVRVTYGYAHYTGFIGLVEVTPIY